MVHVGANDFIRHLFDTLPQLYGDEAKVAINILYDDFFGILPVTAQANRPLATVALTDVEEHGKQGALYQALDQYTKTAVGEFFPGLSVKEFLELPLETCNFIMEISERRRIEKNQ